MVYQEPHFWTRLRTEGQELFAFLFLNPLLQHMIFLNATNSIPEIYGWTCMHFINNKE